MSRATRIEQEAAVRTLVEFQQVFGNYASLSAEIDGDPTSAPPEKSRRWLDLRDQLLGMSLAVERLLSHADLPAAGRFHGDKFLDPDRVLQVADVLVQAIGAYRAGAVAAPEPPGETGRADAGADLGKLPVRKLLGLLTAAQIYSAAGAAALLLAGAFTLGWRAGYWLEWKAEAAHLTNLEEVTRKQAVGAAAAAEERSRIEAGRRRELERSLEGCRAALGARGRPSAPR